MPTDWPLGLDDDLNDKFAHVTLDSVKEELTVWRSTKAKHKQPGFADPIWKRILWLGEKHGETKVRAFLGVSSEQYRNKAVQFAKKKTQQEEDSIAPGFVEIPAPATSAQRSSSAQTPKPIYQPATIQSPEASSVSVVELCRADGVVMKIHTVKDNWPALMQAFFKTNLS